MQDYWRYTKQEFKNASQRLGKSSLGKGNFNFCHIPPNGRERRLQMFKKLVMGGIVSMFLVTMSIPAFAASTCPLSNGATNSTPISNCQNLSQYIQKCKKTNPSLAQVLSAYQAKCNKQGISPTAIRNLLKKCNLNQY